MEALHRYQVIFSLFIVFLLYPMQGWTTPPKAPIKVSLSAASDPQVGVSLPITFSVTPLIDAPQIRVIFVIPDGVEVVEGATELFLSMAKGETREFVVTVILPHEAKYQFMAGASIEPDAVTKLGANASLVIDLSTPEPLSQQAPKFQRQLTTEEGEAVME